MTVGAGFRPTKLPVHLSEKVDEWLVDELPSTWKTILDQSTVKY